MGAKSTTTSNHPSTPRHEGTEETNTNYANLQPPKYLFFTHLKWCLADAIYNFATEWKMLGFDKVEVNEFDILLINITFYHYQKLVFNVLIHNRTGG